MSSSCFIARFFLYLCRIIENIVIMTKANKVLFITQEITPYVSESEMSLVGRNLPQAIQEKGREIRTFMPKWGNINERRNQLHEVIRLSGMNLIIDDTDHPLIIKVASIQSARIKFTLSTTTITFRTACKWLMRTALNMKTTMHALFSMHAVYWKQSRNCVGVRTSSTATVG